MTNNEFENIVNEQLKKCKDTLCSKSKEYDFGEDRLHSFKVAAKLLKTSTEEALLGYLTKHIISIYDMGTKADEFSIDKWEEKITDYINYGLLLKAIILEDRCKLVGEDNE